MSSVSQSDPTAAPTASESRGPGRRLVRFLVVERPEIVLAPAVFCLIVLVWYVVTAREMVSPIILPGPLNIFDALKELVTAEYFWPNLKTTALETIIGFSIAAAAAVALAIVMNEVPLIRKVVYPYAVLFQVVPSIVLAPIFVVWFGFGITSKIVIAMVTAFFVILVNSLAGLGSVSENSQLLMDSLVASRTQILFKLTLPTALPYIFAAFKTASTLALIGALVGEFITAREGLGKLLTTFSFGLKQELVFATVIVVGALGILLYSTVALIEKWVVWWR